jgi:lipoprotein-anchoring transpeptidase ErfK/SrfK
MTGTFRVQSKYQRAWASTWNFYMPYWLGIYWAGKIENGIHGLPYNPTNGRKTWAGMVGTPITFGCIMLDDANAKKLWDVAYIGMPVIITQ